MGARPYKSVACATRSFSTSTPFHAVPKTNVLSLLSKGAPPPPPYPYPRNYWFKQANHGLYGGAMIQFGNTVSERNEIKTRRAWRPNIKHKNIYSQSLDRMLRMKVSTRVLKTIDKVGGLDQYVLGRTPQRIKDLGEEGWNLRWVILNTPTVREKARTDTALQAMLGGHPDSMPLALEEDILMPANSTTNEAPSVENGIEEIEIGFPEADMREDIEADEHMREDPAPPRRTMYQRFHSHDRRHT